MKSFIVLYSYHHKNTEKVAKVIAEVLQAEIKSPNQVKLEEIGNLDLLGLGSGIYSAKNHKSLVDFAEKLPKAENKKAFIFSTAALTGEKKMREDHSILKRILESKGYSILDEFQCKGFNTNSFLKYIGGMNKGRPNAQDLKNAEIFAHKIEKYL